MIYKEAIEKCSDLYQKTYGTKTIEEMNRNYREFQQYQYDVAAKYKVSIEKVKEDVNEDYTARYYDKR